MPSSTGSSFSTFLAQVVTQIVNPLILLLTAAAFVVMMWGIYEFIANAGDETKREEGRRAIFWGIIGMIIIFGSHEIIKITLTTFNIPVPSQLSH